MQTDWEAKATELKEKLGVEDVPPCANRISLELLSMVDKLHARVVQLEAKVEALEKDSHPPVDWSKAVDDAVAASRARAEDEGP